MPFVFFCDFSTFRAFCASSVCEILFLKNKEFKTALIASFIILLAC